MLDAYPFTLPLNVDVDNGEGCTESHGVVCSRVAAYAMLNDFVVLRRRTAAKEVAAAAQARGSGGPMLQNFPEFMLPYIIQVRLLPSFQDCWLLAIAKPCKSLVNFSGDGRQL